MIYKSDKAGFVKSGEYQEVIDLVTKCIKDNGTDKRLNIDTIIHCFRNGIENYVQGPSILTSYKEIGNTFKCLYNDRKEND